MNKEPNPEYMPASKKKKRFRRFLLLIIVIGLAIGFINSNEDIKARFFNIVSRIPVVGNFFSEALSGEWDKLVLGDKLPDTHYKIDHIWKNSKSHMKLDLKMTVKEFYDYIEICRKFGYDIDIYELDWKYTAFNAEGYKISLEYKDYIEELSVEVLIPSGNDEGDTELMKTNVNTDEPDESEIENEPESDEAQPTPIANGARDVDGCNDVKDIQQRLIDFGYLEGSADGVFGSVTERALKEFQKQNGLEATGIADDATLGALESGNAVSKYAQEEKKETASAAQGEEFVDGMRPSIKKAIDSFEEYFVEYVDLIEKIEKNPDNPLLLVEYTEFLATYETTMRDFENMEDEELNDAEMAYYLAAMGRVNQMLINVKYEVDY